MRILYHYTSEAGYTSIKTSHVIWPSLRANNPKDARYGDGQYLSDIRPGTKTKGQLSMIFFGVPWCGKRFSHFFGLNVSGLEVTFGRSHVYVVKNSGNLSIKDRIVQHGQY
jgi:HYD1 signature containing ADP-ribosyltransferase